MPRAEFAPQPTQRREHNYDYYVAVPRRALPLSESVQKTPDVLMHIDKTLEKNERTGFSERVIVDFTTAAAEKTGNDHFFSSDWLKQEVARERQKTILPGETPWYHLSGTGFWVKEQVSQLMNNVTRAGKESFPDVLELELSKVNVDVKHFEQEYLKQMATLTWNLAWEDRDGKKRVVCPDYGNKTWESVTDKKERDGVVYETLFGDEKKGTTGVEGWLKAAPADSFAIMVSPSGWSGYTTAEGEAITYSETQIYAIKKKADGGLQAYTFRYDANIEQNEALQQQLGLSIQDTLDPRERVKNTLQNVALLTPDDAVLAEQQGRRSIKNFEDIVDVMQHVVGGRAVAYDGDGSPKSFDDIRAFLRNPAAFTKPHPVTEQLVTRFQEYARWRLAQGGKIQDIETDLQIALATVPLQLNKLYRYETSAEGHYGDPSAGAGRASTELLVKAANEGINYEREQGDLQERPGCAGGGKKGSVTTMGSSRMANVTGKDEKEWFSCPKCGFRADGPVGNQCPGCGLTKEEYAEESGISCD